MALSFVININPGAGGATLDPPTQNVNVADILTWANNDTAAHWPAIATQAGAVTDQTGLMPNQIQPDDSSDEFRPGDKGTIFYACALHPTNQHERGTIVVS